VVSSVTHDGTEVPVPTGVLQCTSLLARQGSGGTIEYIPDIIVNCSVNKGHSQTDKGGFTLSMKNHVGTMHYRCPSLEEMIGINSSEAILGPAAGPPRQQLCIVDSLWAAQTGPTSPISHAPGRLSMGVFGPVVDIMVARKIREEVMNITNHDQEAIRSILAAFGYEESELADHWIEVNPAA